LPGPWCRTVEGDFFTRVPEGGDVYLLKSVLHDWDDERCRTILTQCRAAMSPRARLVIVEIVLPDHTTNDPDLVPGALLDLIMLAGAGGRERTRSEFAALLDAAGATPPSPPTPRSGSSRSSTPATARTPASRTTSGARQTPA
jgi:hypothetical protein